MTTQTDNATVIQEDRHLNYIKWINRILLVAMALFLVWYYLPPNQELRGRDICSYTAMKINEPCVCMTPAAVRTFLPNGSTLTYRTPIYRTIRTTEDLNVTV